LKNWGDLHDQDWHRNELIIASARQPQQRVAQAGGRMVLVLLCAVGRIGECGDGVIYGGFI
jgi:hypothetical protein